MGNLNISSSQKSEDSTIKYYADYLNDNKHNKMQDRSQEKINQSEPICSVSPVCDIQNCTDYFKRPRMHWKDYFFNECKLINQKYEWCKFLTESIKNFQGNKEEIYLMKITYIEKMKFAFPFHSNASPDREISKISFRFNENELNESLLSYPSLSLNTSKQLLDQSLYSDLSYIQYPKETFHYANNSFMVPNFGDQSIMEEKNKILIDYDIDKYKKIMELIGQDLFDKKNVLCFVRQKYLDYFMDKYEDFAYEDTHPSTLKVLLREMNNDLKKFISIFTDTLFYFYKLDYFCDRNPKFIDFFTLDNMINFVLCILFEEKIYNVVFEIHRKMDKDKEDQFRKKLKLIHNYQPQNFGVPEKFCLNELTINFFKNKKLNESDEKMVSNIQENFENLALKKKKSTFDNSISSKKYNPYKDKGITQMMNIRKFVPEPEDSEFQKQTKTMGKKFLEAYINVNEEFENMNTFKAQEKMKKEKKNIINLNKIEKDSPAKTQIISTKSEDLYPKAINCIRNLQFLYSPSHKLKAILTSGEALVEDISKFYDKLGLKFDKELESEVIMPLYVYILCRSTLSTIVTHCQMIDTFVNENSLNMIAGYYFTTLKAALHSILEMKEEDLNIKFLSQKMESLRKPTLLFYGALICPFVQRSKFFLIQNKIPFEYQEIDLESKEQLDQWYKEINPLSKVPALVIDNINILVESLIINEYLCEAFAPQALPQDLYLRGNIRRWISYIGDSIIPLFYGLFRKFQDPVEFELALNKVQENLSVLIENSTLRDGTNYLFGNELLLADYAFLPFLHNNDIVMRKLFSRDLFQSNDDRIDKNMKLLKKYYEFCKTNTEFLTINKNLKDLPNLEKLPMLRNLGMNSLENFDYEIFCAESYKKFIS